MNWSSQPPPDDGNGVEYAMMLGMACLLSLLMYVLMAVVALVSVTALVLALPFLLLDERRHQRRNRYPLRDSSLDHPHEPGVDEKAGPDGMGRVDRLPDPVGIR